MFTSRAAAADVDHAGSDSIQVSTAGDTLILPREITYQFQPYHPDSSSVSKSLTRSARERPTNEGLRARGSIVRGIQVSSNAALSLQSAMNLNITGDLGDDIAVTGVLAERHAPLQPLGNTRRLNDFDRVHVSVDGPSFGLQIGDLELRERQGHLSYLNRHIEGLKAQVEIGSVTAEAGGGFSYGIGVERSLYGEDGKQGPYRLEGRNGEKFIIIIAGSEEIRLDGRLLQRGREDDYIIDYNAAELEFTSRNIISSSTQITVRYEYVPDIYLSNYAFGKQVFSSAVSFAPEMGLPLSMQLSWQQVRDDGANPIGGIEQDALEDIFKDLDAGTGELWITTIIADSTGAYTLDLDSILVFTGEGAGTHRAVFNFVGLERGRYTKRLSGTGYHFEYDAVNGEYLPAELLHAPQEHAVTGFSGYAGGDRLQLDWDLAISQKMLNQYAASDGNQQRMAYELAASSKLGPLDLQLEHFNFDEEFQGHDLRFPLHTYRQWGVDPRMDEAETFNNLSATIGNEGKPEFRAAYSQFTRTDARIGDKLDLGLTYSTQKALNFTTRYQLVERANSSRWQQSNSSMGVDLTRIGLSVGLDSEEGRRESAFFLGNTHLATRSTLWFKPLEDLRIDVNYGDRWNFSQEDLGGSLWDRRNWDLWEEARRDLGLKLEWIEVLNTDAELAFNERTVKSADGGAKQYYLGDVDLKGSYWEDRLKLKSRLAVSEERLPRFDYHYFEVDTGYGQFSYDPVIQDYFPVPGGRFIRQRIYSDLDEQVRSQDGSLRMEFNYPRSRAGDDTDHYRTLLSLNGRYKDQVDAQQRMQAQSIISFTQLWDRGKATGFTSIEYQGRSSRSENQLHSFGSELSHNSRHRLDSRVNWSPSLSTVLGLAFESRRRELDYNQASRESWDSRKLELNNQYAPGTSHSFELELSYKHVSDAQNMEEYTQFGGLLGDAWHIRSRGRIEQSFSINYIEAGVADLPFSVFSGGQPGTNWEYRVNGRYVFSQVFQLSMNLGLKKRGANDIEQYLRVEGRTNF